MVDLSVGLKWKRRKRHSRLHFCRQTIDGVVVAPNCHIFFSDLLGLNFMQRECALIAEEVNNFPAISLSSPLKQNAQTSLGGARLVFLGGIVLSHKTSL